MNDTQRMVAATLAAALISRDSSPATAAKTFYECLDAVEAERLDRDRARQREGSRRTVKRQESYSRRGK
jgi:hypothetical protein